MVKNVRSATRWRDQAIVSLLEKLAKSRELDGGESILLERTVQRLKPKREVWRWHEHEDRQIQLLIAKRPVRMRYVVYGKPFQRDDDVRELAAKLGRTEMAIYRRIERLRKKCSNAR